MKIHSGEPPRSTENCCPKADTALRSPSSDVQPRQVVQLGFACLAATSSLVGKMLRDGGLGGCAVAAAAVASLPVPCCRRRRAAGSNSCSCDATGSCCCGCRCRWALLLLLLLVESARLLVAVTPGAGLLSAMHLWQKLHCVT